uniref:MHC class II alpha chain N-terminal domain-containing protein n=1 Tax=Acanthochromis polyacanthus TaxID=80966 RepID=A0A3Q1F6D0_9TELE
LTSLLVTLHDDLAVTGCSDSDGEDMYALDREVVWYADFKKGEGVRPQPDFIDPIDYPGAYQQAVANQQICKQNLNTIREAEKDLPLENGEPGPNVSCLCVQMFPVSVSRCFISLYPDVLSLFPDVSCLCIQMFHVSVSPYPDVETTQPGVGPAAFCGVGLTIGLLGVAAGTF